MRSAEQAALEISAGREGTGTDLSAPPARVSVGLPVFNGERYLEEAIDSILAQIFEDFELVISDNGSTDRTEEICRRYASTDDRVKYFRYEENRGLAWNFRQVFELASAKYFMWMSHDDACSPELLQRCVGVLDHMPQIIICYAKMNLIGTEGQLVQHHTVNLRSNAPSPHERLYSHLRHDHYTPQFHGLMRTEYLRALPAFGNYVHSDMILVASLLLRGEFFEIDEYLFHYRVHHEQSLSLNRYLLTELIDPAKNGRICLPQWKILLELFRCIHQTSLPTAERFRCYTAALSWPLWNKNWRRLGKDVAIASLACLGLCFRPLAGGRSRGSSRQQVALPDTRSQEEPILSEPAAGMDPSGVLVERSR